MDQKLQENHKGQFKSSFGFLMAAVHIFSCKS